jgi:aminoglycoside phosphotransferase (APT) family kinase protein
VAYRGRVSEPVTWPPVGARLERELGEPVRDARLLSPPRPSRLTWAARTEAGGELVVKARRGDRAEEKTGWSAAHLPRLAARGYPVPAVVWHGALDDQWHVTVQSRLPGRPLWPATSLTWPMLEPLLRLIELQAEAGVPAGDRDFAGYVANVLFDDWDDVWPDAERASPAAARLCARLRRWLQPVWGLRLPPADYVHSDLNLSNVLADGTRITGVVDWDEFGLGSRALDLVVLAFDCERAGCPQATDLVLARAAAVAGGDGLRCLVAYRSLTQLGGPAGEQDPTTDDMTAVVSAILDRLAAS